MPSYHRQKHATTSAGLVESCPWPRLAARKDGHFRKDRNKVKEKRNDLILMRQMADANAGRVDRMTGAGCVRQGVTRSRCAWRFIPAPTPFQTDRRTGHSGGDSERRASFSGGAVSAADAE